MPGMPKFSVGSYHEPSVAHGDRARWWAWILAGSAVGVGLVLTDGIVRTIVVETRLSPKFEGLLALGGTVILVFFGVLLGAVAYGVSLLGALVRRVGAATKFSILAEFAAVSIVSMIASTGVGLWIVNASSAQMERFIDWSVLIMSVVITIFSVCIGPPVLSRFARTKRYGATLLAIGFVLAGVAAAWIDRTVLVSLYPRAHEALSIFTMSVWFVTFLLVFQRIGRFAKVRYVLRVCAAALVCGAVAFAIVDGMSWATRQTQRSVSSQTYAMRAASKMQQWTRFKHVFTTPPLQRQLYRDSESCKNVRSQSLCPLGWMPRPGAYPDPTMRASHVAAPNIIVFYVDTLRYDVAKNPSIMPNFARFSKASLNFSRTYATGSDTRSVLPPMIRGNFDVNVQDGNDVLTLAKHRGWQTCLVIGNSAREFLDRHVPQFSFDEVIEVVDADLGKEVWGYGANRRTADKLNQAAMKWIADSQTNRFLLWQLHYDLHGWRELDDEPLIAKAKEYRLPYTGDQSWKYNVVAADIDRVFGKFLRQLRDLRLHDNTVVVVVADHGEGLGREGFWVHSVYLWDSLVRVPLMMRVPGLSPQRIEHIVSTADVASTLVRLVDPSVSLVGYHGEDLLTQLSANPPTRRFPIVMRATLHEDIVRLGVVDPGLNRKLVLPLDTQNPELYDLSADSPDDVNIAGDEPAVVQHLLPVVMQGPMNPSMWRQHSRCMRSVEQQQLQSDVIVEQRRRVERQRPREVVAKHPTDPT